MKTINDICKQDEAGFLERFDYQGNLTKKLDHTTGDFDQDIINEILLWKVNRYAQIKPNTEDLINSPSLRGRVMDKEKTKEVLLALLDTKGIRLPVASTILRFVNPEIYQIIDQRVHRFLYGKALKVPHNRNQQIVLYLDYLKRLKEECEKRGFSFRNSDRVLYQADKERNADENIKY